MKNRNGKWKLWIGVAVAAALAGEGVRRYVATAPEAPADRRWEAGDPVLRFADEVVTYGEVAELYRVGARGEKTFDELPDAERQRYAATLGSNLLMAREARARGLHETPAFRQRFLPWAYERLYPVYIQKEITEKIAPPDEELILHVPLALPQVQVRVLVKYEKADADAVYARAVAGEDFEALATAESQGRLREKGGLTTWLDVHSKGMFPPPVVQRFLDAGVGQILPPFYQDIGFLVVKIEGQRSAEEARRLGLESMRDGILLGLRKAAYEARIAELRQSGRAVVFDQVLDRVLAGTAGPEQIVLRVDAKEFSASDLLTTVLMVDQHSDNVVHQRLSSFADKALLGEEALRLGHDQDPAYRTDARFAEAQVLARLLAEAVGDEAAAATPTDQEVRAYYDANPAEFTVAERRALRLIELRTAEEAREAAADLAAGKPFAEVARARSWHAESRAAGGDIGAFDAEQLPEPVREAAFALGEGEHTPEALAGETAEGKVWVLLQVTAVQKAAVAPFESVKTPIVEERIRVRKRAKALSDLQQEIVEKFGYKNCLENPC